MGEQLDVRVIRQALGLTQGQLADKLGVARYTVIRWEQGKAIPSRLAAKALSKLRGKKLLSN